MNGLADKSITTHGFTSLSVSVMILGLKQILDYSVNIRIFGYAIMILNIRIIVLKEIYDMNT